MLRVFIPVAYGFLGLAFLAAADFGYSEGACGGPYTGQDGASYTCGTNRKPNCQQGTGRCQCLERKECPGGKQDEEW
ncbi:conserved exported protein of unknown function [Methylocella tundrae]|uniref:Uncharacterized protein n=1 Tax=Methylocella tundrae TaxID=227605 RepID=A0A4U8YVD6_METTU|nr:conserved exported protein of unknown function [Methylocella tundrae]